MLAFVLLLIFGPACFGVGGVASVACFRRMPLSRSDRVRSRNRQRGPRHGALIARYTLVRPQAHKRLNGPARRPEYGRSVPATVPRQIETALALLNWANFARH